MGGQTIMNQARQLGINLRVVGDRIRYRPKSAATPSFVAGLRQHKNEILGILFTEDTWPPSDAVDLLARWEKLGRPEIPLSPGVLVTNLGTWFHPALPCEHMEEHLKAVRGSIYEGLPTCEATDTSSLRKLSWEDQQL